MSKDIKTQIQELKNEMARIDPTLPFPATNNAELQAIDSICIFTPEYLKWQEEEGQIPEYACTIKYMPDDVMVKHAGLYGMYWQIGKDDRREVDHVFFLQKQ